MNKIILILILSFIGWSMHAQSMKGKSVLLYTKNGKGYVHDNIPSANHCFDSLSKVHGFKLIKSQDAFVFKDSTLRHIDLVIFASTNNDVFDTDEQRLAFRHYVEAGGKILAVHSALGTERNWTWFKQMLGATFAWHPHFQPFDLVKIQPNHPSLARLPTLWTKSDECYFNKELFPGTECILAADMKSLHLDSTEMVKIKPYQNLFSNFIPISWINQYDGGVMYLTSLGHDKNDYQRGIFTDYILDAMNYLFTSKPTKDYKKAYAKDINEPLKNLN